MSIDYVCNYCQQRFVRSSSYEKHKCRAMVREEELLSPEGDRAWKLYETWMKANKRRASKDAFKTSTMYPAFMKFSDHLPKLQLPNTGDFIREMVRCGIAPKLWTDDRAYGIFLEYMDNRATPYQHAQFSAETIIKATDDKPDQFFDLVDTSDVIQLVRTRKLSPWILLHSNKFKTFYKDIMTNDERIILESIIKPTTWRKRFDNDPDATKFMKHLVESLGL